MKLIVGLGNPGEEYSKTRHNLGFIVLDELARQMKVDFTTEKKLKADISMFVHGKETLILAKPQTFMNLSGESVAKIAQFYKITLEDIWIVSDDLDLEFGVVRVRIGGSSGGHNGLEDIITKIGEGFTRFRIGIKNPMLDKIPAEKFVLQKFNDDETEKLPEIIQVASKLVAQSLKDGVEHDSQIIE